jgi:hypothetical protein
MMVRMAHRGQQATMALKVRKALRVRQVRMGPMVKVFQLEAPQAKF